LLTCPGITDPGIRELIAEKAEAIRANIGGQADPWFIDGGPTPCEATVKAWSQEEVEGFLRTIKGGMGVAQCARIFKDCKPHNIDGKTFLRLTTNFLKTIGNDFLLATRVLFKASSAHQFMLCFRLWQTGVHNEYHHRAIADIILAIKTAPPFPPSGVWIFQGYESTFGYEGEEFQKNYFKTGGLEAEPEVHSEAFAFAGLSFVKVNPNDGSMTTHEICTYKPDGEWPIPGVHNEVAVENVHKGAGKCELQDDDTTEIKMSYETKLQSSLAKLKRLTPGEQDEQWRWEEHLKDDRRAKYVIKGRPYTGMCGDFQDEHHKGLPPKLYPGGFTYTLQNGTVMTHRYPVILKDQYERPGRGTDTCAVCKVRIPDLGYTSTNSPANFHLCVRCVHSIVGPA
jgi:hypothetical protein